MRLRTALILLGLVVLPAVVFAVAKSSTDSRAVTSCSDCWTAYPTTTTSTNAEKAEVKSWVAKWKARHPGGTCTISYPDSAQCVGANGLPVDFVVGTTTVVSQSP